MTFTAKYETIDAARAAAARSYESPAGDGSVNQDGPLQVGTPVRLQQEDVDAAHDSLATLWRQVKLAQNF